MRCISCVRPYGSFCGLGRGRPGDGLALEGLDDLAIVGMRARGREAERPSGVALMHQSGEGFAEDFAWAMLDGPVDRPALKVAHQTHQALTRWLCGEQRADRMS